MMVISDDVRSTALHTYPVYPVLENFKGNEEENWKKRILLEKTRPDQMKRSGRRRIEKKNLSTYLRRIESLLSAACLRT